MFGPNVTACIDGEYFHHRGERFHGLMRDIKQTFVDKFGLQDYDVLVVTGSGTLVNEIVMSSLDGVVQVHDTDAMFGRRLFDMRVAHSCEQAANRAVVSSAHVLYETSLSRFNTVLSCAKKTGLTFIDMVSAFPYYSVPVCADVFTTVSSKQLGAYPVLGVLCIRKELRHEAYFRHQPGSILDVYRHLSFFDKHETAHTAAIPLYVDLLKKLRDFDRAAFIEKIDARRTQVLESVRNEWVIGQGPVITLSRTDVLDGVAHELSLYRGAAGYQLFLWSGTDAQYDDLCRRLKLIR